jgi:hypothetical protein
MRVEQSILSLSPLSDPTEITETSEYICGVGALVAGITLAFKQVAPEHKLVVFKLVDIPLRLVGIWAVGLMSHRMLSRPCIWASLRRTCRDRRLVDNSRRKGDSLIRTLLLLRCLLQIVYRL